MNLKMFNISLFGGKKDETELNLIRIDRRLQERSNEIDSILRSGKNKPRQKCLYIIDFRPGIQAKEIEMLREEIDVVIKAAMEGDEVLVKITSPGGSVHGYGHAGSQLLRLRETLPLTVAVDEIAASGGYMCASVAHKIIAAPFALIGSIGVVSEMPNFSGLMGKIGVRWLELTAGEHKRNISPFTEPTQEKMTFVENRLHEVHLLFKEHIAKFRPKVDMNQVATGDYWLATQAIEKGLVDLIITSDEYISYMSESDYATLNISIKKPTKGIVNKLFGD